MKKNSIPKYNSKEINRIILKKFLKKAGNKVAIANAAGILLFSVNARAQYFSPQTGANNPYSLLNNIGQINGNTNGDVIRPEIGDFNKDGLMDFLAVYNDFSSSGSGSVVSVKFNINSGTTTNPLFDDMHAQEYFFDLDIPGLIFTKYQNQTVADIDGDSDVDILFLVKYADGSDNYLCKIIYYENTSTGGVVSFIKNTSLSTINSISASNCPSNPNMNALISTADLNNDGLAEIYLFEHSACAGGTDITRYERTSASTIDTYALASANPASGTFLFDPFAVSTELEFADFDNDGDTDIILSGTTFYGGATLYVFMNESSVNNSFSYAAGAVPQYIDTRNLFNPYNPILTKLAVALKDLNNDGRADLTLGTIGSFSPPFPDQSRIMFLKSQLSPVPVRLLSFGVQKNYEKVFLTWATVLEQNSSHFDIERSNDGIKFEKIGEVKAAGNSGIKEYYSYTDVLPKKNLNYYRLKEIDKNGKFIYSPLRLVKFEEHNKLAVYPNPVMKGENLHLNLQNSTANKIQIINTAGQVLYNNSSKSTGVISVPISASLVTGQYIIRVTSEDKTQTQKILIL